MTIYSLDLLLFLFGTSLLFYVQFYVASCNVVMAYYSAINEEWNLTIYTTGMGPEGITLSEISQRKTNTMQPLLYVKS